MVSIIKHNQATNDFTAYTYNLRISPEPMETITFPSSTDLEELLSMKEIPPVNFGHEEQQNRFVSGIAYQTALFEKKAFGAVRSIDHPLPDSPVRRLWDLFMTEVRGNPSPTSFDSPMNEVFQLEMDSFQSQYGVEHVAPEVLECHVDPNNPDPDGYRQSPCQGTFPGYYKIHREGDGSLELLVAPEPEEFFSPDVVTPETIAENDRELFIIMMHELFGHDGLTLPVVEVLLGRKDPETPVKKMTQEKTDWQEGASGDHNELDEAHGLVTDALDLLPSDVPEEVKNKLQRAASILE